MLPLDEYDELIAGAPDPRDPDWRGHSEQEEPHAPTP